MADARQGGGALTGLVEELRKRQGWTMDRLAEAAGMSEQALQRLIETPGNVSAGDASMKALSKALQVDAWLLERAASSRGENVDELVRIAERLSGGTLSRLRSILGSAVPDGLDEAVLIARQSVSPAKQLELAHLITVFTRMDPVDREFLLALAARLLEGSTRDT